MKDTDACCDDAAHENAEIDRARENSPGRSALEYRLGTRETFFRRMLAAVPSQTNPGSRERPLARLNVRATDDPAIALLDAWATVGDVLTFYQERIANEGFLRTSLERRSVLELARSVGYELAPGVAATAYLAFTVEDATPVARVPVGTRVQSLPGQEEVPQSFETSEEIEARAEWNILRPRRTQPQDIAFDDQNRLRFVIGQTQRTLDEPTAIYLKGTSTNLKPGDRLLIRRDDTAQRRALRVGDGAKALLVHRVVPEPAEGRTRIEISENPRPFSPDLLAPITTIDRLEGDTLERDLLEKTIREEDVRTHVTLLGKDSADLAKFVNTVRASPEQTCEVFAFRQRVAFFGHNAQTFAPFDTPPAPPPTPPADLQSWGQVFNEAWLQALENLGQIPNLTIWEDSQRQKRNIRGLDVFLERPVPEIVPGGWVIFIDPAVEELQQGKPFRVVNVAELSIADFSIAARSTGMGLRSFRGEPIVESDVPFHVRTSSAFVQSERLLLVDLPYDELVLAEDKQIMLDRLVLGLRAGQPVWIRGERADQRGILVNEVVIVGSIVHDRGYTTLLFDEPLQHSYVRSTVTVNANVALATHGETITREVLGSGDASTANQRFLLKKANVTYLSAPTETGVSSAVSIRVNDIPWREVPSLFGQDPTAQVYVLSRDDDGRTTVIFGDGQAGARLPTGQENVVVTYRTGIHAKGAVAAGSLSLLQTRPLGIRGVVNPLPSTGAEGPDSLEEGRVNAPVAISTLGRVVTLQDYEDFVRAFAGIGKAKAASLSIDGRRVVHVTAVSDQGEKIEKQSAIFQNLQRALVESADPDQEVRMDAAEVHTFAVRASVVIDPRRISTRVLADAHNALINAFSLTRRDLGQDVTPAEVIQVLQQVPGVIAALLLQLKRVSAPDVETLVTLPANLARFEANVIRPAQLLLIDPQEVVLTEISE